METIQRKTRFITDFFVPEASPEASGRFLLSAISARTGGRGGRYLTVTLADRTGEISGKVWENFDEMLASCGAGCFVDVKGRLESYQGTPQLVLTFMKPVSRERIWLPDFLPATQYEPAALEAELRSAIAEIREPHLRHLLLSFVDDPVVGPHFFVAPAAKKLHHAWLHGLLEHVVFLIRVIKAVAPMYPEVNLDLVITGAILHDFGKVRELSWDSSFQYTLEGQLIGHISIVQRMLAERIAALEAAGAEPFPEPLRLLLEHLLLAHHGKLEFGSPKLPMTPEALLFSTLDDLEAKFQTMRMEFAAAARQGRPVNQPTEWVRSMDRALFDSERYLQATMPRPVENLPQTALLFPEEEESAVSLASAPHL